MAERMAPQKNANQPVTGEAALWDEFRNGHEAAYARLYDNYFYLLYSYGNKITADTELVEDCIQDLFVRLWESKHRLGPAPSVKNYLLKAFRRRLQEAVQKQGSRQSPFEEQVDFQLTLSWESEASQQQLQLENEQKLQAALQSLSARQKEVIYLRFYKKLTNEEIAEVMAISIPSVYNLVSHALKVLENHLYPLSTSLFWLLANQS